MEGEERIGVKKGACGYEAEQRVAQEKTTATPWREVIGALIGTHAYPGKCARVIYFVSVCDVSEPLFCEKCVVC